MKKYAFLLLFALLCLNSFSQLELKPPPSKTPTTSDWEIEEQNHNCLHRNKYSRLERLQFYPFNKASYIKIVSFNGARIDSSQTPPHRTSGLPRKNDTICYKAIYESANLTAAQLDSLTNILYNVGYSGPVHSISENDCFNSRNAIVFLNKKAKFWLISKFVLNVRGIRQVISRLPSVRYVPQNMSCYESFSFR